MSLVPTAGDPRRFALATLVDSVGLGLYSTASIIIFIRVLQTPVGLIGVTLTLGAIVGTVASVPAGALADALGHKRALISLQVALAALFTLLPLVRGPIGFVLVVGLISLCESAIRPIRRALLRSMSSEEELVRTSAVNRVLTNIGLSVGSLGAGIALALKSNVALTLLCFGNALSFVLIALLFRGMSTGVAVRSRSGAVAPWSRPTWLERWFLLTGLTSGILYLHASLLEVGLPLLLARSGVLPTWSLAAFFGLNTVLVIFLQIPVSRRAGDLAGSSRANLAAGVALCLAAAFLSLAKVHVDAVVVVAVTLGVVLLTGAELLSSAGSWGLSYGLASGARQAEQFAAFGAASQVAQVAGPLLAIAAVSWGARCWVPLAGLFLVAGLASPAIARRADVARAGRAVAGGR